MAEELNVEDFPFTFERTEQFVTNNGWFASEDEIAEDAMQRYMKSHAALADQSVGKESKEKKEKKEKNVPESLSKEP